MKRRTVLVALGATAAATTGCTARSEPGSAPADDSPGPGETDEPATADPTDANGTETPDTGWPDGRFADEPCPSFSESDRTICYHTLDYGSLWVAPSRAVFEPTPGDGSVETIEFTLHNETSDPFGLNPHAWAMKRRTDDGWAHVAPEAYPEPWLTVEDGETYTWRLGVEEQGSAMAKNLQAITVDLESGVHAFAITGQDESDGGDAIECVALFEVDR
jgi:hypothetical protein